MPKANPKAWFTSPIAKITYRSVDRWARNAERWKPFFPTWEGAHDWMLERASNRLKMAKKDLASAERHLDKVKAMKEPA